MNDLWTAIAHLNEVPQKGARRIVTTRGVVAIFRTVDNRVFAVEDRCPHRGGPLSQGIVHGTSVSCPLHGWVIDLEKAEAREPDRGCIRRYPIRVRAGTIEINLDRPTIQADPPEAIITSEAAE